MSKCHSMACYSDGFEYVIPFLDFEPDSGKVLNGNYLAFVVKPIPCPRDWGCCAFEYLSVYIVSCVPLVTNGDGVFCSWFDGEWTSDC